MASATWIIEDSTLPQQGQCAGHLHVTGFSYQVSAYRAELQGLHAIFVALTAICLIHQIQTGSIVIGCDGLSAIQRSDSPSTNTRGTLAHADLIRAIRRLRTALPCQVIFQHIRGHQDNQVPYARLPRLAQLNVLCNHLAKQHMRTLIEAEYDPDRHALLLGEGFRCYLGDKKLTSHIREPVLFYITSSAVSQRLHEKEQLSEEAVDMVDWRGLQQTISSTSASIKIWISKFTHGHLSVGRMMKRWRFQTDNLCPCCQQPNETTEHLLTCPDPRMRAIYNMEVTKFAGWLSSMDTAPACQAWLISFLHSAQYRNTVNDDNLSLAICQQTAIGKHNLLLEHSLPLTMVPVPSVSSVM